MTWSISISGTEGEGADSEQHLIQLGEKAQAFVDDLKDLGVSGGSLYHSAGTRSLSVTPAVPAAPAADVSTPASPAPDAQPAPGAVPEPAPLAPADPTGSEATPVADATPAPPPADQGAATNEPAAYTQPAPDQYVDPTAAPAAGGADVSVPFYASASGEVRGQDGNLVPQPAPAPAPDAGTVGEGEVAN